jgi:Spy/CpxP family protein refolding chaperone
MKFRFLTSLLFIAPALLPGQDKGGTLLYPGPNYTEIKQYLSLTDAQMQSLQSILDNRNQALQNLYNQINQKNQTLYQLLNSDSGTAAQLGQLMIDVRNLQKQIPLADGPYKTQALNVLTAEQKAKLPKLSEVLQLQNTAIQAGMLLFIDYPQYVGPPGILAGVFSATGASSASARLNVADR